MSPSLSESMETEQALRTQMIGFQVPLLVIGTPVTSTPALVVGAFSTRTPSPWIWIAVPCPDSLQSTLFEILINIMQ